MVDLWYPLRVGLQSVIYAPTVDPESYEGWGRHLLGQDIRKPSHARSLDDHIINIVSRHKAEEPEEDACRAL